MNRPEWFDLLEELLEYPHGFLACVRPESTVLEFFRLNRINNTSSVSLSEHNEELFVVHPFDKTNSAHFYSLDRIASFECSAERSGFAEGEFPMSPLECQGFEQLVQKALVPLRKGEMKKVVLSARLSRPLSSLLDLRLERLFHGGETSSFRYLMQLEDKVCWLGDTPETLLAKTEQSISTMALAGTRRKNEVSIDGFTSKEFEEQEVVVQELVERLNPLAYNVEVFSRQQATAGTLVHLKTNITAKLPKGVSDKDVLEVLHPTAAVCGFPRENAIKWIHQEEVHDRELYAGYLGFQSIERSSYFVNLRCARYADGLFEFFVGAGITADSESQKEVDEIQAKTATMMRMFSET